MASTINEVNVPLIYFETDVVQNEPVHVWMDGNVGSLEDDDGRVKRISFRKLKGELEVLAVVQS